MGVPGIFRRIVMKYPEIIFDVKKSEVGIDNLFIDANAMIHPCARMAIEKFQKTNQITNMKEQNNELEKSICDAFVGYLGNVINIAKPDKLLYIAVDGPAPRAKINQQRSRRYKSAKLRKVSDEIYGSLGLDDRKSVFDTNAITPGCFFMKKLMVEIEARFTNTSYPFRVIFSSSNVAGEGEHKVMSYLRNHPEASNQVNCIYGLDADLIFLSLASNLRRMLLIREHIYLRERRGPRDLTRGGEFRKSEDGNFQDRDDNVYEYIDGSAPASDDNGEQTPHGGASSETTRKDSDDIDDNWGTDDLKSIAFDYLSIDRLRDGVCDEGRERTRCSFDSDKIIRDYIFICFLLGNDFLPHLPSLSISTGGLDILMKHYYGLLRNSDKHLILADGSVNSVFFKKLLSILARDQDKILLDEKRQYQFRSFPFRMNPNKTEKENEHDEKLHDFDIVYKKENDEVYYGNKGWKWRYWNKYFGCSSRERPWEYDMVRKNVVYEYFKGLKWTRYYYYNDLTDWRWYYPYEMGPTLSDLVEFSFDINDIQLDKSRPFKPLEQLLMVLPSSSSHLLPKTHANLMIQETSPILEYYPVDFRVHAARKIHYGETIPRLPIIEFERIANVIKHARLTALEKECNVLEKYEKTISGTDKGKIKQPKSRVVKA